MRFPESRKGKCPRFADAAFVITCHSLPERGRVWVGYRRFASLHHEEILGRDVLRLVVQRGELHRGRVALAVRVVEHAPVLVL